MENLDSPVRESLGPPSSPKTIINESLDSTHYKILLDYKLRENSTESSHNDHSVTDSRIISSIKEPINHPKPSTKGKRKFSVHMVFTLILLEIAITVILLLSGSRYYIETNDSRLLVQNKFITKRIPLLLDFSSNDTLHASRVLSKCLNLTSAPIEKYQVKSTYLYAMSLA